MRLIDADALIDDIKNHLWDWETVNGIAAQTVLKQTITDVENQPTASPWHRVEEPPKKTAKYLVLVDVNNGVFAAYPELRTAAYNVVYERWYVDGDQRTEWIGTPRYWMPIEPPKEEK